jgi:flagellar hook protein FlgE
MSLFNTLNTGVSGLGTNGLGLSVTGDNIANLNTAGFKGSSAEFQDLFLQNLGGNKGQLGMGAFTGRVRQGFGQGSIETTGNAADLALDGKGFFAVADSEGGRFFTRAGQFSMNTEGNLVGLTGMKLQGYSAASDGSLSTTVGDITIPTGSLEGTATTSITLEAALAAGNAVPTGSTLALSVPPVWSDLTNGSNTVTTSTKVYDSLGNSHDVTLAFTRVGTGSTYEFEAFVDAGDTGGTPGEIVSIGSGSLAFDTSGNLDAANSTAPTGTPVTFTGAAAQTIGFDFGLATGDTGALTMRGNTAINPTNVSPDGNPSGTLATFDIGADGVVTGIYSNGESRALGQVVVASFVGESFLTRVGHNMWQQSKDSGEPVIGEPGTGGRGATVSYALEMSNVDLEQQFVKLIQSQKGYQANTRIVSTADDMLQELMQTV